jgi:hypothetical protein
MIERDGSTTQLKKVAAEYKTIQSDDKSGRKKNKRRIN